MTVFYPYGYTLKCPHCGADIALRDLLDQSSFWTKGKVALCKGCERMVTWDKASIRRFAAWINAFTASAVALAVLDLVGLNVIYQAAIMVIALMCLLFATISPKLSEVSS